MSYLDNLLAALSVVRSRRPGLSRGLLPIALDKPVAQAALDVRDALFARGITLDHNELFFLVGKIYDYCEGRCFLTPRHMTQLMHVQPQLIELIAVDRGAITHHLNFSRQLETREHNMARAQSLLQNWNAPHTPLTPVYQTYHPDFSLHEMSTPVHLMKASIAHGHCAGTSFNYEAMRLSKNDVLEFNAEAPHYLTYAIKMRNKDVRMFSLEGPYGSCLTMAYDTKHKSITDLEGDAPNMDGSEEYFGPMCDALGAFMRDPKTPVKKILRGLPPPPDAQHTFLTRRNGWVSQRDTLAHFEPEEIIVGISDFTGTPSLKKDKLTATGRVTDVHACRTYLKQPPWMKLFDAIDEKSMKAARPQQGRALNTAPARQYG